MNKIKSMKDCKTKKQGKLLKNNTEVSFKISKDPFYSKNNIFYLESKFNQYKKGKLKLIEKDIIKDEIDN